MKTVIVPFEDSFLDDIEKIENLSFSVPWSRDALESSAKNPFVSFFVALFEDIDGDRRVTGYTIIQSLAPDSEILTVAVSPEARRQGIAQKLILTAESRARELGCDKIMLEVRESNSAARALYEKNGFFVTGRRRAYYTKPLEDALLMDKNL